MKIKKKTRRKKGMKKIISELLRNQGLISVKYKFIIIVNLFWSMIIDTMPKNIYKYISLLILK